MFLCMDTSDKRCGWYPSSTLSSFSVASIPTRSEWSTLDSRILHMHLLEKSSRGIDLNIKEPRTSSSDQKGTVCSRFGQLKREVGILSS
jgi:hypothetical protein